MKVRILTENIEGLGLGHVARSFNLALKFLQMGYEVDFFVRGNKDFMPFIETQLKDSNLYGFYPLALQWESLQNPAILESDICIIDSYAITDFSLFLRYSRILVLLDDDGRHFKLLEENIGENNKIQSQKKIHATHVTLLEQLKEQNADSNITQSSKKAELYLLNPNGFYKLQTIHNDIKQYIFSGLEYALLNSCFQDTRLQNMQKTNEFFVCFGGEDLQDKSMEIFTQLQTFALSITIVVGANYKGKLLESPYICVDSTQETSQQYRIFHNISQDKLAELMAQSTYCIVSGGGILFEALKLCQNVFALKLANNQNLQIDILERQQLLTQVTMPIQKAMFSQTHIQEHNTQEIGTRGENMLTHLICNCINHNIHSHNKKIKKIQKDSLCAIDFCSLAPDEINRVLSYRNHEFVRQNMYANDEISMHTHIKFLESLRYNQTSQYFLVQELMQENDKENLKTHHANNQSNQENNYGNNRKNYQDIGVISLIRINLKHRHAYLGIYKNPYLEYQYANNIDSKQANIAHHTSRSYGSKLMSMIQYIAFQEYHLNMLYLEVVADNKRAIDFYYREGFEFLGTLRDGFRIYKNGKESFANILIFGIKNPYYNNKKE